MIKTRRKRQETINLILFLLIGFLGFSQTKGIAKDSIEKIHPSKEEIIIGEFKNKDIWMFSGTSYAPKFCARYFSSSKKTSRNPYIKGIVLSTDSKIDGAKLKLHFFEVSIDGSPGKELLSEGIDFYVKIGKNNTNVDLNNYELIFPKNGIFVGFEWLIIEENKSSVSYSKMEDNVRLVGGVEDNKMVNEIYYEPSIGMISSSNNSTWNLIEGKWIKALKQKINQNNVVEKSFSQHNNSFNQIAVELILSNKL